MATIYHEKQNYDDVELSAGDWNKEAGADGSRISYTATNDTATITVHFRPPREIQTHGVTPPPACKTGSKVIVHKNGQVEIEQKT